MSRIFSNLICFCRIKIERLIMDDQSPATKRYSLRDSSKSTSRYRNFLAENTQEQQTTSRNVSPSNVEVDKQKHLQQPLSVKKRKNIAYHGPRMSVRFVPTTVLPRNEDRPTETGNEQNKIQEIVVKGRQQDNGEVQQFDDTIGAEQEITTSEYV